VQGGALKLTALGIALLLLAGCSGVPQAPRQPSPCDAGEATSACQIQRYHDIAA
jgi:outer membrane biogenesis lipoprotein LolB